MFSTLILGNPLKIFSSQHFMTWNTQLQVTKGESITPNLLRKFYKNFVVIFLFIVEFFNS